MFDQDEQEISQIIETSLRAIQRGEATLEQVLAQHPGQAEQIRPELEVAVWLLARREEVAPRAGYLAASRARVVERIRVEAAGQGAKHAFFGFAWPKRLSLQWVAAVVVVIFALLSGTSGLVSASQNTLPGDGLYAVKRITEQVAYSVTLNDIQRVELSAQFADRRLVEVEQLMAAGNYSAAETTLKEFNQQVIRTVSLLEQVSNTQAREKIDAAVALKEDLASQAGILLSLQANAPTDMRGQLLESLEITNNNVTATDIVIMKTPGAKPFTHTPQPSTTPPATETPVPPSPTPTIASSIPVDVIPAMSGDREAPGNSTNPYLKAPTATPTTPGRPTRKPTKTSNVNPNSLKNEEKTPPKGPPDTNDKNNK